MFNLLGLFNVVFTILCRTFSLDYLRIASTCMSGGAAFGYAVAALWLYGREISESTPGSESKFLTDGEMQRRQFLGLLQQGRSSKGPGPKVVQRTFHVNTPGLVKPGKSWDRLLSPLPRDA